MKSRMTLADVMAEVRDLGALLLSMRLLNVYDVDDKTLLFRFKEPGRDAQTLLVESGIRLHTTRYSRERPPHPGGFCMKLRKHLRGRRLTGIAQVGLDRVIDLTFGEGAAAYHLILELYDRGNVILTDGAYVILSLLRKYTLDIGGAGAGGGAAGKGGADAAADEAPGSGEAAPGGATGAAAVAAGDKQRAGAASTGKKAAAAAVARVAGAQQRQAAAAAAKVAQLEAQQRKAGGTASAAAATRGDGGAGAGTVATATPAAAVAPAVAPATAAVTPGTTVAAAAAVVRIAVRQTYTFAAGGQSASALTGRGAAAAAATAAAAAPPAAALAAGAEGSPAPAAAAAVPADGGGDEGAGAVGGEEPEGAPPVVAPPTAAAALAELRSAFVGDVHDIAAQVRSMMGEEEEDGRHCATSPPSPTAARLLPHVVRDGEARDAPRQGAAPRDARLCAVVQGGWAQQEGRGFTPS